MNFHWMFGVRKKNNEEDDDRAWYAKLFRSLLFDLALLTVFLLGALAFYLLTGANVASAETYQPLASGLPGLKEVSGDITLGEYVNILYKLAIGLGSVVAVLMLVIAGFQYMASDSFTSKDAAKSRINGALMGLVLLLASFLILNTINPELVSLKFQPPNFNEDANGIDLNNIEVEALPDEPTTNKE